MQPYYLGIDVSKGYADFVMLDRHKQKAEDSFQLDDTFEGHCLLYEMLCAFTQKHPDAVIYAAVESTGGYENNWFGALGRFQAALNLKAARLNPLGVSANSKADLKRNVTDRISAQSVAEYMIAHPEKVPYQQEDILAPLRKQWVFVRMLTKQSTQLLNQLESLIYTANPELLAYCKEGTPDWMLKLLMKYPTASNLSRAKVSSVAKIPYITSERAGKLVSGAKKSVASATDRTTGQLIAATVRQILHLKKTVRAQTEIMAEECSLPEVRLLKTFRGMGDFSAVGMMLQIQSAERFSSVRKLAAFFGIHPELRVSGDGSSKVSMSRKGRKEPRNILYMVTLAAIQHNSLISSIYQERLEKGMEKMAAVGYCMHKILRIIYGMLKHSKPFDPETDRKNRENSTGGKVRAGKDKNRRYQDFDPGAPVSGRQSKKRKEQSQSQSDNNTEDGIAVAASV